MSVVETDLDMLSGGQTMLGEKLGEIHGQVTGQRVLPPVDGQPKTEVSYTATGTLLGVSVTHPGTYWSIIRADGSLYGESPWQGIIMTQDGVVGKWGVLGWGSSRMRKGP